MRFRKNPKKYQLRSFMASSILSHSELHIMA